MKVTCNVGNLQFEIDAKDQKGVFEQLSSLGDVFGEKTCGVCGGEDIRYRARAADKFIFYENVCLSNNCRARLSYGQSAEKPGELFPKRKLTADNQPVPEGYNGKFSYNTRGWHKWVPNNNQESESPKVEAQAETKGKKKLPF